MNNASITIAGNATRDPEVRFTAAGLATVSFSVAVNRRIPGRGDSNPTEAVSYFQVVAFQQLAENIAVSVQRGTRVVVTGRLDQRTWEGAGGEKRTVYELVAEDVGTSLKWSAATVQKVKRVAPTADELRTVVFGADHGDRESTETGLALVPNVDDQPTAGAEDLSF
jgi:single-strand DNA-binding protein